MDGCCSLGECWGISMANKINMNSFHARYSLLLRAYPKTLEWVRHKARWEHMPLGAVLNQYREYIDELMAQEDAEHEGN